MAEGIHPPTPIEPGHRYNPRRASPRLFDVSHPKRLPKTADTHDQAPSHAQAVTPSQKPVAPKAIDFATATVKRVRNSDADSSDSRQTDIPTPMRPEAAVLPAIPRQRRSLVLRRQMVAQATQHKSLAKAQRKRSVWAFTFGGAVASLVIVAGLFLYLRIERPQVLSAETEPQHIDTAIAPSEDPIAISDIQQYTVPDGEPRLLFIKTLGVTARIYPVKAGFKDGPLSAPSIYDVGWLLGTAKPGDKGAALINGSVTGSNAQGIFSKLGALVPEQKVSVEMGDGTLLSFRVVETRLYDSDKVDMVAARTPIDPDRPGLNLLTDVGRFNVRTNSFEQRRLVMTVLE